MTECVVNTCKPDRLATPLLFGFIINQAIGFHPPEEMHLLPEDLHFPGRRRQVAPALLVLRPIPTLRRLADITSQRWAELSTSAL